MKEFKTCLISFIYAVIIVLVFGAMFWLASLSIVYHHQKTTASMVPELTGSELKLLIPFKVKPDDEEFRLGEIYIDKQGYLRQKKGE